MFCVLAMHNQCINAQVSEQLLLPAGQEQEELRADIFPGRPREGLLCPERHLSVPARGSCTVCSRAGSPLCRIIPGPH